MTTMKTLLRILLLLLLPAGLAGPAAALSYKTDFFAEFYYRYGYPAVQGHKAIAIGPRGAWRTSAAQKTAEDAASQALDSCNADVKIDDPQLKNPCALLVVDDQLKMPLEPMGGSMDAVAPEPDTVLDKGMSRFPEGATHGSVIFVTSCYRVNQVDGFVIAWTFFYNALGYRVFFPDGFAEPRPPELCGLPGDRIEDQSTVIKLQMAQTRRNIATLNARYPGEPIILQGQGQGGWVVQALGAQVAAVVATGTSCGVGNTGATNVPQGVPYLVIAGGSDSYVPTAAKPDLFAGYCNTVTGPGKPLALSVPGKRGLVAEWWPGVTDAISALLKQKPMKLTDNYLIGPQQIDMLSSDYKIYSTAKAPKAWAQNGSTHGSAWQHNDLEDAKQYALFYCAYLMNRNPYLEPTFAQTCAIADAVDGPAP